MQELSILSRIKLWQKPVTHSPTDATVSGLADSEATCPQGECVLMHLGQKFDILGELGRPLQSWTNCCCLRRQLKQQHLASQQLTLTI